MQVCERSYDGKLRRPSNEERSGGETRSENGTVAVAFESSSDEESKAASNCNGQSQGSGDTLPHSSPKSNASSVQQKRPMNAFLIFCKRHRSVVKQKYPYLENRSITKILGEWWAALDVDQKHKYTELARQYKEAFMKANPHFKWYKTDIKAPAMQPPSPPPPPPPPLTPRVSEISNHCSPVQQNVQQNSTPKPPKKRYLESREFKGSNNHVNHTPPITAPQQTETKRQKTPPLIGGPPILDIETMNRVIENAFGANPSNNACNLSTRSVEKAAEYRSFDDENVERNERNKYQRANNNVNKTQSASNGIFSSPDASTSSHDTPLNLSSSKVLHTSNQQIIDHFIDKLLSTAPTGNPMPIEMQVSQSSMNPVMKSQRKERQCKGKRYLEMLNESKMTKRNKSNGVLTNDDSSQKSNGSNSSSLSKWVSGGFDLEQHIAALPQLGDKHLVNALNHSKANKSSNGVKTSFSSSDHKASRNESETDSASSADSDRNDCSSVKESNVISDDEATLIMDLHGKQTPTETVELNGLNFSEKCRVLDCDKRIAGEFMRQTQGIECDGLTALAEVALQQANRVVSLQSSS